MSFTLETKRAARGSSAGRTRPPFVLVTGGKGGVGKTTVAANLGVALGKAGADPVMVDLDFGLANLDLVLGVEPSENVESFFNGERRLEDCLVPVPAGGRVLAAGSGSYEMGRPDPARRTRLRDALDRTRAGVVIGDSPAGIGDDVLDFAAHAERVLVVTTPEPAAFTDAFGVIKAVDAFATDAGREVPTPEVFVNFASDAREAQTVASKLAALCERFLARSPRFVGWMPRSRAVLRGVIDQRPIVDGDPSTPPARAITRLARRYANLGPIPSGVSRTNGSEGHGR